MDGMFDMPNAKRIRRADLYSAHSRASRSSSPQSRTSSPDPELRIAAQKQLAALYGPVTFDTPSANPPAEPSDENAKLKNAETGDEEDAEEAAEHEKEHSEENPEQEFEFRLFSSRPAAPSKKSNIADPSNSNIPTPSTTVQRIILNDSDSEDGEGAFITKPKPLSYYILPKADGEKKQRYDESAVDGETILQWSRKRHWGLEVPWRVKVLHVTSAKVKKSRKNISTNTNFAANELLGEIVLGTVLEDDRKKKTKPNKKLRILLRERRRKVEVMEKERKRLAGLKEEQEKDKKTRRNREKKVKRRLKEKAEKEAKKAAGGGVDVAATTAEGEGGDKMEGIETAAVAIA